MTIVNHLTYLLAIGSAAFVDIIFLAGFEAKGCTHCLKVLHLASFGMAFGLSIWNIFLAGMILIRTIPRHMFGKAQSNIVPAYLCVVFSMSCLMLGAIFLQHPYAELDQWGDELFCQVLSLAAVMIAFAIQILVVFPKTTKIINKMYVLEREAGIGQEVAMRAPYNEELQMNTDYQSVKKSFKIWHGITMLISLGSLALLCYHLNYLAGFLGEFGPPQVVDEEATMRE